MKILLLEDELMLQSAITEYLEEVGYEINAFENGKEVLEHVLDHKYDLFIFDINTPGMDGLTLLTTLQDKKIHVPTVFISAITEMEQISQAYALGCYDYLKKPFHLKELNLHIDRLCKIADIRTKEFVKLSTMYSFNLDKKCLLFDGEEQVLTPKQTQIMQQFALNKNRIIDFEMLRHYIWDDKPVDNAVIRAEIHRLRQVLKEELILTIKGIGYKVL